MLLCQCWETDPSGRALAESWIQKVGFESRGLKLIKLLTSSWSTTGLSTVQDTPDVAVAVVVVVFICNCLKVSSTRLTREQCVGKWSTLEGNDNLGPKVLTSRLICN